MQQNINLFNLFAILIGGGLVGYFSGVIGRRLKVDNSAWYALGFLFLVIGSGFLIDLYLMKGALMLPFIGVYIGTMVDTKLQNRKKAKAAKIKFEADKAALTKSVDSALATCGSADAATIDVSAIDQKVLDAVIAESVKRGLGVASQHNHNSGERSLAVSGQAAAK